MDNSNDILRALSEVPDLSDAAKKILASNEEFKKLFAEMMKQRVQAEFTPEELRRAIAAIIEAIKKTPCALPDTYQLSRQVADNAVGEIKAAIKAEAKQAVKEAVQENPVTLAKPHEYAKYIEPKLRNWTFAMTSLVISFILFFVGAVIISFNSKEYYGQLYMEEVLNSNYITDEEHDMLVQESYVTSALPNEFKEKPKYVKKKIKQWVEILKQREKEAKLNDGKYSVAVPLER